MGKTATDMMGKPPFMAEVSSNHHQDLQRCLKFIEVAAGIGCSYVKFQLFKVVELFTPEVIATMESARKRVKWELPVAFLPEIAAACREKGIGFGCTPFYLKAVEELYPYVDLYKVASYELLWDPLLIACALTGKPLVLSTGMATMDEIGHAVEVIRGAGCEDLTLLHCVSYYPVTPGECNLKALGTLRDRFGVKTGWSDHSVNPGVIYRAINRWDAEMIEFHLDLEGEGEEFKTGHCWLPGQIEPVIRGIEEGTQADGDGVKAPMPSELPDRDWRADPSDGLRPMLSKRGEFH